MSHLLSGSHLTKALYHRSVVILLLQIWGGGGAGDGGGAAARESGLPKAIWHIHGTGTTQTGDFLVHRSSMLALSASALGFQRASPHALTVAGLPIAPLAPLSQVAFPKESLAFLSAFFAQ